jgi:hypothetical protein
MAKTRAFGVGLYVSAIWLAAALVGYGLALRNYAADASKSVRGGVSDMASDVEEFTTHGSEAELKTTTGGTFYLLRDFALDWDELQRTLTPGRKVWVKFSMPKRYALLMVADFGMPTAHKLIDWHEPAMLEATLQGRAAEDGFELVLEGLALLPGVLLLGWIRRRFLLRLKP